MKDITGQMIYYYLICKRKLWYSSNHINMEQNSELVSIGKILDENSYERENKHILIDENINLDFIKSNTVLHEVKKSKSIEEAGIWQLKYYIYYLENKGVEKVTGRIDYPLLKQTKEIILSKEDKEELCKMIEVIKVIVKEEKPPQIVETKICKKCAYCDLCFA